MLLSRGSRYRTGKKMSARSARLPPRLCLLDPIGAPQLLLHGLLEFHPARFPHARSPPQGSKPRPHPQQGYGERREFPTLYFLRAVVERLNRFQRLQVNQNLVMDRVASLLSVNGQLGSYQTLLPSAQCPESDYCHAHPQQHGQRQQGEPGSGRPSRSHGAGSSYAQRRLLRGCPVGRQQECEGNRLCTRSYLPGEVGATPNSKYL